MRFLEDLRKNPTVVLFGGRGKSSFAKILAPKIGAGESFFSERDARASTARVKILELNVEPSPSLKASADALLRFDDSGASVLGTGEHIPASLYL